jgi:hypothetical protein
MSEADDKTPSSSPEQQRAFALQAATVLDMCRESTAAAHETLALLDRLEKSEAKVWRQTPDNWPSDAIKRAQQAVIEEFIRSRSMRTVND